MQIIKANIDLFDEITNLFDAEFVPLGMGFINKMQIKTEIERGNVIVAIENDKIIGCRIGIKTIWNLVVAKKFRGNGIGRQLVFWRKPTTIRVKSIPVGHLSKKQKESFADPSGFYENLGFEYVGLSTAKNFYQNAKDGKAKFHKDGKKHIKIYKDKSQELNFLRDG